MGSKFPPKETVCKYDTYEKKTYLKVEIQEMI